MMKIKEYTRNNQPLKKSKSICSLSDSVLNDVTFYREQEGRDNVRGYRRSGSGTSESSVEIAVVESDGDEVTALTDSGLGPGTLGGHALQALEIKIDKLNDVFLEQCRLLTTLKEDIRNSKTQMEKVELAQAEVLADMVKKTLFTRSNLQDDNINDLFESNSRARSLLDAIEARQGDFMDQEIRDALASFLQSDELREHMVAATAASVRGVIGDCISRDLSSLYLPMLEHSHRRVVRQVSKTVEDAFKELEDNSACMSRSVYRITRSLRRSIERHQNLLNAAADPNKNLMNSLKCTVEELLHNELKQWRQKVLDVFILQSQPVEDVPEPEPILETAPPSPLQPPNPDRSIIDQLMMAAEIANQIKSGDVNAAFERALSAADLSLVTAACRSGHARVFTPQCLLHQHVLLALLQQLSTDMLHETQLKCSYLEDSILNLDVTNPATRAHLPLVVGEVRKHLTVFLASYPSHVASRRVALIIMAADNLLK